MTTFSPTMSDSTTRALLFLDEIMQMSSLKTCACNSSSDSVPSVDLDFGQRHFNFSHSQVAQFQLLLRPVIHDDDLENSTCVCIFFLICTVFCILLYCNLLLYYFIKCQLPQLQFCRWIWKQGGKVTVAKYSTQVYDAKDLGLNPIFSSPHNENFCDS